MSINLQSPMNIFYAMWSCTFIYCHKIPLEMRFIVQGSSLPIFIFTIFGSVVVLLNPLKIILFICLTQFLQPIKIFFIHFLLGNHKSTVMITASAFQNLQCSQTICSCCWYLNYISPLIIWMTEMLFLIWKNYLFTIKPVY